MKIFLRCCIFILFAALLDGCKQKKTSLSGEDPVEVSDFIDFFPAVKLPYQFADTSLLRKERDSLLISYKVFTQFVPDSVLNGAFGKGAKLRIYPMGRVVAKKTYLFAKIIGGDKRVAFVLGFDKDNEFIAALPLLHLDASAATQQIAGIDNRYALTRTTTRKNSDGTISEGRDVYDLPGDATDFSLVMTDPLDDKMTELINPIDTFSRKQKFSADYGSGKMNLVSFRDGRKNDRLNFFIHFEKNGGECTGELKSEAIIKSASQAEYHEAGEPCSLQFNFTSASVTIKELDGCGSRRGLRCSFNGMYAKKKEVKPKATKPKKSAAK
jgi:hypothetical protein